MSTPFRRRLALIVALALVFRVGYVLAAKADVDAQGDAIYYAAQAQAVSDGEWFRHPHHPEPDGGREAADHAPLTSLVLAPVSVVWSDSLLAQRLAMAVLGAGVVLVVALLTRRIAGDRTALVAAALAAAYPNLWLNDVLTMSETLTAAGVAGILLAVYRFRDRPGTARAAVVGALVGVTVLARAEIALLLPAAFFPVALLVRSEPLRRRLTWLGASAAAAMLLLLPWTAYNLARFDEPVLVSHNDGLTLVGTNCEEAYNGQSTGYWLIQCLPPGAFTSDQARDQSVVSHEYRSQAIGYARDHLSDLPRVALVRFGLAWSAHDPSGMVRYTELEDRDTWASWLGLAFYYPMLVAGLAGAVVMRRRGWLVLPLASTAVVVTVTAVAFYGHVRFRIPAEVALVVLTAIAVDGRRTLLRS